MSADAAARTGPEESGKPGARRKGAGAWRSARGAAGSGPEEQPTEASGPEASAEAPRPEEPPEASRSEASAEAGTGKPAEAEGTGGESEPESEPEGEPEGEKPAGAHEPDAPEGEDAVSAPGPDGEPVRTTRRFPSVTRDTARPEGGGRAAPGGAPAPARQWPLLTVLVTIGVGLLLVAFDVTRVGLLLVGLALLGGAVMRWCVRSVGMLAVRSRFTDMVTYGVLGFLITLLALMAQPKPWLPVPFLEGLMRFTVR
ncbi:DUF3017 domain-containing protein [Streptomyces sp. NBC_01197]|nr:DUF3017 domain-containing protein [Streptomyces sp. NBC_01197]